MLEIFPGHKEVVVPADPGSILQAVNDRAVTRLLVEAGCPAVAEILRRDTRTSAYQRIRSVLAYHPSGRVAAADVTVAGNEVTEGYVAAVLDPTAHTDAMRSTDPVVAERILHRSTEVSAGIGARIRADRVNLLRDGRPAESFRRTFEQGLARLALREWSRYRRRRCPSGRIVQVPARYTAVICLHRSRIRSSPPHSTTPEQPRSKRSVLPRDARPRPRPRSRPARSRPARSGP